MLQSLRIIQGLRADTAGLTPQTSPYGTVRVDADRIAAIQQIKPPTTIKQPRRFIPTSGYISDRLWDRNFQDMLWQEGGDVCETR